MESTSDISEKTVLMPGFSLHEQLFLLTCRLHHHDMWWPLLSLVRGLLPDPTLYTVDNYKDLF